MSRFAIETLNEKSFDAESVFGKPLPIKWMPLNNTDINYMTSPITQYKGSAILRMLDHILGKDVFDDGVRRYLNAQ